MYDAKIVAIQSALKQLGRTPVIVELKYAPLEHIPLMIGTISGYCSRIEKVGLDVNGRLFAEADDQTRFEGLFYEDQDNYVIADPTILLNKIMSSVKLPKVKTYESEPSDGKEEFASLYDDISDTCNDVSNYVGETILTKGDILSPKKRAALDLLRLAADELKDRAHNIQQLIA